MRDVSQHRAHARGIDIQRFMEVTPRVGPACDLHQAAFGLGEEAVVRHVGIGLQISAIRLQKLFGPGTFSRRRVIEHRRGMIAIPEIRPESPLSRRPLQVAVQHFHRRIIGAHHLRTQHEPLQLRIQRIEQLRRLPHPATQGLVWKLHAEAAEDLRLPVHGQVVGHFADDHLRQ